jgi:hypothetical protein
VARSHSCRTPSIYGAAQIQSSPLPGFGAVYVPSPQTIHVHVNAEAADGGSSTTVGLGVQLLDASRNPVIAEQFGGTSVDFEQPLSGGYYILEVRGGVNSPNDKTAFFASSPGQ